MTSIAHTFCLKRLIANKILNSPHQQISFAQFMEYALLWPELGYYARSSTTIGNQGDFVTAPEISSLWTDALARYSASLLRALGETAVMIEVGAGTGRMAADLMLALNQLGIMPKRYIIVEPSATLRRLQQVNLKRWIPQFFERLEYLEKCPEAPVEGIIVANEVMDALPVHRFCYTESMIQEMNVAWHSEQFVWRASEPSSEALKSSLATIKSDYLSSVVGQYYSEVCLTLQPWLASLQRSLSRGCIILIDYGGSRREYYHPSRSTGTLRSYYQHKSYHDPLAYVGCQDITSDVDFTQVALSAAALGLSVEGFTSQADFLLSNGLLSDPKLCYDDSDYFRTKGQIHQLLALEEMGERCKVMTLAQNFSGGLPSLGQYDRRMSL